MTKRRGWFQRPKLSELPSFFPDPIDTLIIKYVRQYKFATKNEIIKFFPDRSAQTIGRRLGKLYKYNYLDRPNLQKDHRQSNPDDKSIIYGLGDASKTLLQLNYGVRPTKTHWSAQTREAHPFFLAHTLKVGDTVKSFEFACRRDDILRMVHFDEILSGVPEAMRKRRRPYEWKVNFQWRKKPVQRGVKPDRIFALEDPTRPADDNRGNLFLELDRGTEIIDATDINQSSILEKLVKYGNTYKLKLHKKLFGMKNFRVLFVITTPSKTVKESRERIAKCIKAYKDHASSIDAYGGLFLFADLETFEKSNPLTMPWINGREETVYLHPKYRKVPNRIYDLTISPDDTRT